MTETPLFDVTGVHCLRSVQGPEEGTVLIQKLEEGSLHTIALGDLLKLIVFLEIPLEVVIEIIGEAKVSLHDTP